VVFNNLFFDPNKKVAVPLTQLSLDRAMVSGKCGGIKEGWRFIPPAGSSRKMKKRKTLTELISNDAKRDHS
jgi:hypothetical protein